MKKYKSNRSNFLKSAYTNRKVLKKLAKDDFKKRYAGSIFGVAWGYILPLVYILVMWFVFTFGFRTGNVTGSNVPYILWLTSGLIPWFYFTEAWNTATNSITEYSFLVKKVVFQVETLPLIKIISALYVHIFFIAFTFVIMLVTRVPFSIYNIQIIYYLIMMWILLVGVAWFSAAVTPFFRDFSSIVGVCVQVGFWFTPIFWNLSIVPIKIRSVLELNPVFYFVQGYRDSFFGHVWFWQHGILTIWYWVISLIILFVGGWVFKKLRPHFADVL